MELPSPKVLALNAAAIVMMGAGAVAAVRHHLAPPQTQVCAARYPKMTAMGLERGGALLTADDVQSQAIGLDHGVASNLAVKRLKDAPAPVVLGVTMKAGTAEPNNAMRTAGGVSFPWMPRAMPKALDAACLSYNVFLPVDFDFDAGGTLPGLFGVKAGERVDNAAADRFDTRLLWSERGGAQQFMVLSTAKNSLDMTVRAKNIALARGRWVRIDQEVVLNTPKQQNGVVRLWIDGALVIDGKDAELRYAADVGFTGVMADAHFGGNFMTGIAKKNEQVWITPFELRWN